MKRVIVVMVVAATLFVVGHSTSYSWGFYAHKRINRLSVFTLPPDMIVFYKKHIEFITEHAVDPDKRRYAVDGEAPRHFIDIDHYSEEDPFGVMPRNWKDAIEKYTEDTIQEYGIVPWHLEVMLGRLTWAFKDQDLDRILKYSSDFGHYIGDAHVPLHTTENYNGQMTNQKGIHGFWESRLPELFSEDYEFWVGKARYIDDPRDYFWTTVEQSHAALDSVLDFERDLNDKFPQDQKYNYETRGTTTMKQYSREYSTEFHIMMDGMVERRMKRAIITIGCMWYTAWVNAGQPDLEHLGEDVSDELLNELKKEDDEYRKGKIKGRDHGH